MDLSAASEYASLSVKTLRRAIDAGRLKYARPGGKILVKRSWVDQFICLGHARRLTTAERIELNAISE